MIKIGLMGAPGTGKSTLAAGVFAALKDEGLNGELIQEYIREHIYTQGVPNSILFQAITYERQLEKENIIPRNMDFLVTDSPTTLSYIYSLMYADLKDKDHKEMVSYLYSKTIKDIYRYDLVFLLEHSHEPINDGVRYQSKDEVAVVQHAIINFLENHNIKFIILKAEHSTSDRIKLVKKLVKRKIQKNN